MGFVVSACCLGCDFESESLTIGDAKHVVCICRSCNSVVNPEIVPFRFELRPCPKCEAPLDVAERLDMLKTVMDHEGTIPSDYDCPRCGPNRLAFKDVIHFSMGRENVAPTAGSRVHGRLRDGSLHVSGMFLPHGVEPKVAGLPPASEGRRMELLTGDVERDEGAIESISFSFVKYLDR